MTRIAALVFPYGLCMVVLTGSDLCTGSFMFTTTSVLQRRLSIWKMLIHWFVTVSIGMPCLLPVADILSLVLGQSCWMPLHRGYHHRL